VTQVAHILINRGQTRRAREGIRVRDRRVAVVPQTIRGAVDKGTENRRSLLEIAWVFGDSWLIEELAGSGGSEILPVLEYPHNLLVG
jgi:hypothetical protein